MTHLDRVLAHTAHPPEDTVAVVHSARFAFHPAYWALGATLPTLCNCSRGGCWFSYGLLLGMN